jgi:hypothetical protein
MSTITQLSIVELQGLVLLQLGDNEDAVNDSARLMNGWLERGDGVAVYRNDDFGHPEAGRLIFVSYGSSAAQLEGDEPPQRLPDIGGLILWRYQLAGVYRGGDRL